MATGGSKPVRIGNGAYDQLQLDIYGELMDSVYLFNRYGEPISFDFWTKLRQMTNWVCDNWRLADEGIWETRGRAAAVRLLQVDVLGHARPRSEAFGTALLPLRAPALDLHPR